MKTLKLWLMLREGLGRAAAAVVCCIESYLVRDVKVEVGRVHGFGVDRKGFSALGQS